MKHVNWAVQCPQDYATNEKWKSIIQWLENNSSRCFNGASCAWFYGFEEDDSFLRESIDMSVINLLSIDEALEMLFSNPVKFTIYQELVILSFKQENYEDKVLFDIFGVHPYLMKKKVTKNSKLIWNFCIPELDLIEYWVDGIKVSTMKVDEVKEFLSKIESK
mgnify:FL=1